MDEAQKKFELRILENFIRAMPPIYRKRTRNWCVVHDILMYGTRFMGSTSCWEKCIELGIRPDEYSLVEDPVSRLKRLGYKKVSEFCKEKGITRQYVSKARTKFDTVQVSEKIVYIREKQPDEQQVTI
jgi:hypothetical protein